MKITDAMKAAARAAPLPPLARGAVKQGNQWRCLCPIHDDTDPSCDLTPKEGEWVWHCKVCDKGGDAISFIKLQDKVRYPGAVALLLNGHAADFLPPPPKQRAASAPAIPAPEGSMPPTPKGSVAAFSYRNMTGQIVQVVHRIEGPNGKSFMPFTWDGQRWQAKALPVPRPLYGLDRLDGRPVVLVEGEGKADKAQAIDTKHAYLAWSNGASATSRSDFSPLAGHSVTIWPDNDEPGLKAARAIQKIIPSARVINVTGHDEGWDCGDAAKAGWTAEEFHAFIADNAKTNSSPRITTTPAGASDMPLNLVVSNGKPVAMPEAGHFAPPREEPPSPVKPFEPPFRILGWTESGDVAYYHPTRGLRVVPPAGHTETLLRLLAPESYWIGAGLAKETKSGRMGDIDVGACQSRMWEAADKIGYCDPSSLMRGNGAWIERGRPILHLGDRIVDEHGKSYPPSTFPADNIYAMGTPAWRDIDNSPLSDHETGAFYDLCQKPLWSKPLYGIMFAGWAAIAPVAGALPWRPHLWVRGPAGTGKSTLLNTILTPLLGEIAQIVLGATTDAGIRKDIGRTSYSVLFDEAEVNGEQGARETERIQRILFLARACSSDSAARLVKGGDTEGFHAKSAFYCTSIGTSLRTQPDDTRWTVLSLEMPDHKSSAAKASFNAWKARAEQIITQPFAYGMAMRFLRNWDTFMENREIFKDAIAEHLGSGRTGDQVGTLFAAAAMLRTTNPISKASAVKWVSEQNWSDQELILGSTDDVRILQAISESTFNGAIGGNNGPHVVGTMLEFALMAIEDGKADTRNELFTRLRERGFRPHRDGVDIALAKRQINQWLKDSPYASMNYGEILEKIPGARRSKNASTIVPGKARSRYITIPWEAFGFEPMREPGED